MEGRLVANLRHRPSPRKKDSQGLVFASITPASSSHSFVCSSAHHLMQAHTHSMDLLAGYSGRYSCSNERKKSAGGVVAVQVTALSSDSLTTLIF